MAKKKRSKKGSSQRDKVRDRAKRRAKERESEGGMTTLNLPEGCELFKPKKGTMHLDILPYKVTVNTHPEVDKGELWYQRSIHVCFNVGPEQKAMLSPLTIGKKCPQMAEFNRLRKQQDADWDTVKQLKPKDRELFNVFDKDDPDKGVQVWDVSVHNFGSLLEDEICEGEEDLGSFFELEGGKTLVVRFKEKKFGKTKFLEASSIKFEDREDYEEDTLDDVFDLDEMLIIPTFAELEKEIQGVGEEDDDEPGDDDEDADPEEDEDDDEDSEEDDDDDDDDESDDGDDDDDDDDASDDDDDDSDDEECPACEGTGESSKGKKCRPCKGTGTLSPDDIEDDDDDDDDDEPSSRTRTGGRKKKSTTKKKSTGKKGGRTRGGRTRGGRTK